MIRQDNIENITICDRFSKGCFLTKMRNATYAKKSCFCLPKCNSIHFTYSEEKIRLNIEEMCENFASMRPRKEYRQLLSKDLGDFLELSDSYNAYRLFLYSRGLDVKYNYLNFFVQFFESVDDIVHPINDEIKDNVSYSRPFSRQGLPEGGT